MSLNRATAKTFFSTLDRFKSYREMVERAVDPTNPSLVKTHPKNREKLDNTFIQLDHDWNEFKREITSGVLNENDENGDPKYEHNDHWMNKLKDDYYDLIEKSETVLENASSPINVSQETEEKLRVESEQKLKHEKRIADSLSSQITSFTKLTSASIDKIVCEVRDMVDANENVTRVNALISTLHSLNDRIDNQYAF